MHTVLRLLRGSSEEELFTSRMSKLLLAFADRTRRLKGRFCLHKTKYGFVIDVCNSDSWQAHEDAISGTAKDLDLELRALIDGGGNAYFDTAIFAEDREEYALFVPLQPATMSRLGTLGVGFELSLYGRVRKTRVRKLDGQNRWRRIAERDSTRL